MLTLDINQILANSVITTAKEHHIDENFYVDFFTKSEMNEFFKNNNQNDQEVKDVKTKIRSAAQQISTGFFIQGDIYVAMFKKPNPKNPEAVGTDAGKQAFNKLIKNAILKFPNSSVDLSSRGSVVTVNGTNTGKDKIDNNTNNDVFYFAAFKLKD